MSAIEKMTSKVTSILRGKAINLREEHEKAVEAVRRAEAAWEETPGEKRWTLVEDARRRVAQLDVKIRRAEEAERAEVEGRARAERDELITRFNERRTFAESGYREPLSARIETLTPATLAFIAELNALARLRDERHQAAREAADIAGKLTNDELPGVAAQEAEILASYEARDAGTETRDRSDGEIVRADERTARNRAFARQAARERFLRPLEKLAERDAALHEGAPRAHDAIAPVLREKYGEEVGLLLQLAAATLGIRF